MNLRARFATSLAVLLAVLSPMRGVHALETPTPAPCTPTFRFDSSSYSVTEEQGIVTLTVLRECIGAATSVTYSSTNITATSGSDYTGVSGTLNFGANDTSKTINVIILNDSVAEAEEAFRVTLSGSGITSPDVTTVTISDGVPTVSITASPTSGLESGEPTAKFTVSLSASPSSTVTVPISLGGTATRYGANIITDPSLESPTDRWWLNSENNKGAFTRTSEDAFFGSSCAKFSASTMDGWMIPSYKLDLDIPTGGLAIQPYTLSFYAKAAATRTLWAHIAGINSLDLMADLGNVTITPTWKRYTITFTPLHNGAAPSHYPNLRFSAFSDELPLTLYIDGLKLEQAGSASKFGDYEFFGKNLISNSDLESASTNWFLNSGGGDGTFSRVSTTAYSGYYSAKYSATTFGDWLIPTYAVWSDIHPDGLSTTDQYALSYYAKSDAARTLSGTIGNGNGTGVLAYFGEVEFGTSWKRYEYFFTPPISGAPINYPGIKLEALSNDVPFTLYWDKLQLQKVTPQTSVTFAAGETVKVLEMPVINDRIYEAAENIIVDLVNPVGADRSASQGSATFAITNDEDPLTASFPSPDRTKSEGEAGSFSVTLSHDNTEVAISVPFSYTGTAVRNSDYTAPNSIDIAAGAISGTLEFDTADDGIDEIDETAIGTIGTSSTVTPGSPAAATLTIVDENPAPTVQLSASTATVNEDAETIQVTAQLSTQSGKTVTVQYATATGTAITNEDFTLTTGTLTFNPGQASKNFIVPITIDCKTESSENFTVALSNPSNATLGATTLQTITVTDGIPCALIEVSLAELQFGEESIYPGPSECGTILVTNIGNAGLEFLDPGIQITGANPGDFRLEYFGDPDNAYTREEFPLPIAAPNGPNLSTISPADSREFQVVFNPEGTGARSASLVLTSNSSEDSWAVIPLEGIGTDPNDLSNRESDSMALAIGEMDLTDDQVANCWMGSDSVMPLLKSQVRRGGNLGLQVYQAGTYVADQTMFGFWSSQSDCNTPKHQTIDSSDVLLKTTWSLSTVKKSGDQYSSLTVGETCRTPLARLRVNSPLNEESGQVVLGNQADQLACVAGHESAGLNFRRLGFQQFSTFTHLDQRADRSGGYIFALDQYEPYLRRNDVMDLGNSLTRVAWQEIPLSVVEQRISGTTMIGDFEGFNGSTEFPSEDMSFLRGWTAALVKMNSAYRSEQRAPGNPDTVDGEGHGSFVDLVDPSGTGIQVKLHLSSLDSTEWKFGLFIFSKETGIHLEAGKMYRVRAEIRSETNPKDNQGFRLRVNSTSTDLLGLSFIQEFTSHGYDNSSSASSSPREGSGPSVMPSAEYENYDLIFVVPPPTHAGVDLGDLMVSIDILGERDSGTGNSADSDIILKNIIVQEVEGPLESSSGDPDELIQPLFPVDLGIPIPGDGEITRTTRNPVFGLRRLTAALEDEGLVDRYVIEVSTSTAFPPDSADTHVIEKRISDLPPDSSVIGANPCDFENPVRYGTAGSEYEAEPAKVILRLSTDDWGSGYNALKADTVYYWRAKVVDILDQSSAYTSVRSLKTEKASKMPYRCVNLLSPWNFPQFSWPDNGVFNDANLSHTYPLTSFNPLVDDVPSWADDTVAYYFNVFDPYVTVPDWQFEEDVIKEQIRVLNREGYNTYRLLLQRPFYYTWNGGDPCATDYNSPIATSPRRQAELRDCWDKIERIVRYIQSIDGKVVLSYSLGFRYAFPASGPDWGWDRIRGDTTYPWSPNSWYYESLPPTFFNQEDLGASVLTYEIDNEPDALFRWNQSGRIPLSFLTTPYTLQLGTGGTESVTRLGLLREMINGALSRFPTGDPRIRAKISLGAAYEETLLHLESSSYNVNPLTFGGQPFSFPILNFHEYRHYDSGGSDPLTLSESVLDALGFIESSTASRPVFIGEVGVSYRWYQGNDYLYWSKNGASTVPELWVADSDLNYYPMAEALVGSGPTPLHARLKGLGVWSSNDWWEVGLTPQGQSATHLMTTHAFGILDVRVDRDPEVGGYRVVPRKASRRVIEGLQ